MAQCDSQAVVVRKPLSDPLINIQSGGADIQAHGRGTHTQTHKQTHKASVLDG